jgi:DNA-binding response OmpR family regulator
VESTVEKNGPPELFCLDLQLPDTLGMSGVQVLKAKFPDIPLAVVTSSNASEYEARCLEAGADAFITADLKYHEFFDAEGRIMLADVGHFESEQHTVAGLATHLQANFPTFAILNSEVVTNPVQYFL